MTATARKKAQPAKTATTAKPSTVKPAKAAKATKTSPAKAVAVKETASVPHPRAAAAKAAVQLTFQEPDVAAETEAAAEPAAPAAQPVDPPREVNGIAVIGYETLLSPRSYTSGPKAGQRIPMSKRHLVLLADGTKIDGCTACTYTGTLSEVVSHVRNFDHDTQVEPQADEGALFLAEDMPKRTGTNVPTNVLMLTIGQAIQYGTNSAAWARDRERLLAQVQAERARAAAAEKEVRRLNAELSRIGGILQRAAGAPAAAEAKVEN